MRRVSLSTSLFLGWSVLVLLFVMLPSIVVVLTSLGAPSYVAFPPRGLTLRWYTDISPTYVSGAALSAALAGVAASGSCLLGVPAAFALVRGNLPGSKVLESIFRLPLMLPQIVIGVVTFQTYALIAKTVDIRLAGSFLGLALIHVAITVPFVVTAVGAALVRFPADLEDAAQGLGASSARTFFRITLPVIKPAVFAGAFFAFLVSFDNVPVSLFLVGAGTQTLPLMLFNSVLLSLQPSLFAVSTLVILLSVVLTALWARFVGVRNAGL